MGWFKMAGLSLAILSLPAGMSAQEVRQRYDLSVAGIKVAQLSVGMNTQNQAYTTTVSVRGKGLVGAFVDFGYNGTASGRIRKNGRIVPVVFNGTRVSSGKRQNTAIQYKGATPVSVEVSPPRKARDWDVDPTTQKNTLDPISAAHAILSDRPVGEACGRSVNIFDGLRRSRIRIGQRQQRGNGWACTGVYSRVAGFSPKRMREQVDFPFVIFYQETNGTMRVTGFDMDSILGQASVRRR